MMKIDSSHISNILKSGYKPFQVKTRKDDSKQGGDAVEESGSRVNMSPVAKSLTAAVKLQASGETLRPEKVRRAREILQNWKPPTDQQIDHILRSMIEEA